MMPSVIWQCVGAISTISKRGFFMGFLLQGLP
jgi:hypothetical protein